MLSTKRLKLPNVLSTLSYKMLRLKPQITKYQLVPKLLTPIPIAIGT